jgi:hypothetical protein
VIVDASGLAGGVEPAVFEAVGRFCQHRKIVSAVPVLLAGTDPEDRAHWQGHAETATMAGSFETALEEALERSEYRLVRRR